MVYNLTAIATNATGIYGLTVGVNNVLMFGWLGTGLLIAVTIIALISFYYSSQDTNVSVAGAAFIALGLSLFLKALGLIPGLALYITLIVSAAAIAFTWKNR